MNIRQITKVLIILILTCTTLVTCNYQPYAQGERLYIVHCENCHAKDGSGLKKLIPPISHSNFLQDNFNSLSCIIKFGISDTLRVNGVKYTTPMAGIPNLTAAEIANISNFIIYEFEYNFGYFSEGQVNDQLSGCN